MEEHDHERVLIEEHGRSWGCWSSQSAASGL